MSIEIHGVSKVYGEQRALFPVDMTVEEGEFVTLLGPSGCGKTTLLRIIAGFVKASSGRVLLDGKDITDVPENRREVGLLFQSYALFPHMTVAQNVAFGLKIRRLPARQVAPRVDQMLALVSMLDLADRYPRQLSGGQQQRVALARVLAIAPKVLLLDEPLSALDRQLRIQMQVELARLIAEVGITTLFVTHDQEEALTMSDRIAVMEKGSIAQYATPDEVYDYPASNFVASFVGRSNLIDGLATRQGPGHGLFTFGHHRLPAKAALDDPWPAGPRTLLVRPEHLAVTGEGGGMPGRVAACQDLGDAFVYLVDLEDGPTVAVRAGRARDLTSLQIGDQVGVAMAKDTPGWLIPARAAT